MARAFTFPMLRLWPPRRRARIESIDAEAEALIRDLGAAAYSEARCREYEASSDAIAKDWDRVALAVARKIGGLGPASDAADDRVVRAALEHPAPAEVDEPKRFDESPRIFRIQYVGSQSDRGSSILKDVEIEVPNVSSAIVAAAKLKLPPGTIGLRILDREGREVFERHKGDGA